MDDVDDVARYCDDMEFARTTLSLPWPYERAHAVEWIQSHANEFDEGNGCNLAITRRDDGALVGSIALRFEPAHHCAELGYGVYRPFWNNGYGTEAAAAMIRYGFEERGLNRIHAHYFACNPASGRIMQKCGMQYEGTMRKRIRRFDTWHDIIHYAILREA